MMQCAQCGARAIIGIDGGKLPLCVQCYNAFAQAQATINAENERLINFLSDYSDMTFGLSRIGPRFPARPPQAQIVRTGDVNLNHIKIDRSTIGVLNTGTVQSIDSAVSAISETGNKAVALAVRELANAIASSTDLNDKAKNEAMEFLEAVSSEAKKTEERRQGKVADALVSGLGSLVKLANDLGDVWKKWGPVLMTLGSGDTPTES